MTTAASSLITDTQQGKFPNKTESENNPAIVHLPGAVKSEFFSIVRRIAEVIAVAGPIIFIITIVVLESLQPGYNRIEDTISALVWGEYGWCLTVVFYLLAFALACLAWRLGRFNTDKKQLRFGIILLALISLGFIIIAVFPTKAPGALVTLKALIHRQTARTICSVFPFVCLLIAKGLQANANWNQVGIYTLVTSGLSIFMFLLGIFVTATGASWLGILERLILANGLIWCVVMGIWLIHNGTRDYRLYAEASNIQRN